MWQLLERVVGAGGDNLQLCCRQLVVIGLGCCCLATPGSSQPPPQPLPCCCCLRSRSVDGSPNCPPQVLVSDPKELERIREREAGITAERIAKIIDAGANVILTTKGIDDMSLKYFVEAGAIACRRVPKDDLRWVAGGGGRRCNPGEVGFVSRSGSWGMGAGTCKGGAMLPAPGGHACDVD